MDSILPQIIFQLEKGLVFFSLVCIEIYLIHKLYVKPLFKENADSINREWILLYTYISSKKIAYQFINAGIIIFITAIGVYYSENALCLQQILIPVDFSLLKTVLKLFDMFALMNFISIIGAFYYFYYKEQKSIAESYLINHTLSLTTIFLGFLTIGATICLYVIFAEIRANIELQNNLINLKILLNGLVFAIIDFVVIFYMFITLLRSLNIKYLLQRQIIQFNSIIDVLQSLSIEKENQDNREMIYKELMWRLENIYQMLIYTADKNINSVYSECIKQWGESLMILYNSDYLSLVDFEKYSKLYKHILKNHKILIFILYKSNKKIEARKALMNIGSLAPNQFIEEESVYDKTMTNYFFVLWELNLFFLENNSNLFHEVMQKIISLIKREKDLIKALVVFQSFIIISINNTNTRFVTELCYVAQQFSKQISISINNNVDNNTRKAMMQAVIKSDQKSSDYKFKGKILYILIHAGIKSVELGKYNIIGFLVKYIVSNFDQEQIELVYAKIIEQKWDDVYVRRESLFKLINYDFNFNKDIMLYCIKKFAILIYFQEKYVYRRKCNGMLEIFHHLDCFYTPEYIMKKIDSAGSQYGLMCVTDKSFFSETVEKLKYEISKRQYIYCVSSCIWYGVEWK